MAKDLLADSVSVIIAKQPEVDADIDVVVLESVDSTNSWCLQQCKAGKALPFVCYAREQTSGRGRRGKQWVMTAGSDIAMSIAWPFAAVNQSLQLLPLSIALAIAETLESLKLKQVQVKWPNDVYVQGKKIAGILIETQPVKNGRRNNIPPETGIADDGKQLAVVIGIGLNYDMAKHDQAVIDSLPALTDICEQVKSQEIAVLPERDKITRLLQEKVVAVCQQYPDHTEENLKKFRARFDYCKGKNVEIILDNKEVLTGMAQGVSDSAELLVLDAGEQRVFTSAEVSVRPHKMTSKS